MGRRAVNDRKPFWEMTFEEIVKRYGRTITHGAHFAEYTEALRPVKSLAKRRGVDEETILELVRTEYRSGIERRRAA